VVQQSLSQIRTVAAYNGEEAAAKAYDAKLDTPQKVRCCSVGCLMLGLSHLPCKVAGHSGHFKLCVCRSVGGLVAWGGGQV